MLGKNEIGMTGEESISKNAEGDRRRESYMEGNPEEGDKFSTTVEITKEALNF